jgi:hypothetical protein
MSGATENKDGSKKKWIHGRAVEKGTVRFLSVSALEKADASKPNGCLRRWWYQYIGGIKEPPSKAMLEGEQLHREIATYLETGHKALSSQVLSGLHMIPDPGPDLLIEHDIIPAMPDGKSGLAHAVLKADGIPVLGAIDLIHARGINKGTNDITDTHDPAGTIEVIDWKTCRTLNHAKPGPELLKSIQMVGYGKYIFEAEPDAKLVRLSHGYFPKQGTPRKTTIRADRGQINKSWEHANRVASSIRDAAKETNPDLVEANTQACTAFGKDCPAKSVCSAVKNNVMAKFVGNLQASQLIPPGNLIKKMENAPNNGILAAIKAKQAASNLPEPRPNRGVFGSIGATKAEVTDEKARLKAELERLEALEKEALKDEKPDLSNGPELLPPDAPESDPMLASKPQVQNSFTEAMAAVAEEVPVVEVVEKKKRGPKGPRKPKVETSKVEEITKEEEVLIKERAEEISEMVSSPPSAPSEGPEQVHADPVERQPVNLYVNCSVEGVVVESLWPLIDHLIELLNQESKSKDFRLSKDLEYGKWKAALTAFIHATPIPGGNYALPRAHGDIGQVVVEAMGPIIRKTGGVLVVGG